MRDVETKESQKVFRSREVAVKLFRNENATLIIVLLALIGGMAGVTKGLSIAGANMRNIVLQSAIRGVVAVGQAFVILTGGIDVSVGGVGLFSSILGCSLMTEAIWKNAVGYPVPVHIAIPVMVLVGAGWGAANGLSVSRISMPPLIVTLAMWEMAKGAAFRVGQGYSIESLPDSLVFFGSGRIAGVPLPVIILIVVAVIGYFTLQYTSFGRSIYATGGNPASAWLSGINIKNIQFFAYTISGLLAGLSGAMISARTMRASMQTLTGLEIDSIAAVTIGGVSLMGGRGTMIGVIIGVLIIGVINNGMSILRTSPEIQGVVKGAVIIAAVAADYLRRRR